MGVTCLAPPRRPGLVTQLDLVLVPLTLAVLRSKTRNLISRPPLLNRVSWVLLSMPVELFQLYSGGVYTSNTCSSSRLNHAVTCVGYGSLSGTAYWTVKNSWGTGWGDNGYILMQRNYNNMCVWP